MPGLLRGVARTAVIAGTATAVSNRVSRRQAGRWARQAPPPEYPPQPEYAPQQVVVQAAPQGEDMEAKLSQLRELSELKSQGVLTEEEFQQQKRRILNQ
jgi:hypothetical protein